MVDTGYPTNTGNIVQRGEPPVVLEKKVETAANMYPGRLVKRGTTDFDAVVGDAIAPPTGWLGYEHTSGSYRKDAKSTIQTINDYVAVLSGSGFAVSAKLAAGFNATKGDKLCNWTAGQVAPCAIVHGSIALKVPYTKKTSEFDTTIDLPSGMIVHDAFVYSVVADASGTIDIGILSSESGGDADGFLDGEALAATGWVAHNMVDATAANITLGLLLDEVQIKDATSTPVYTPIMQHHKCDGTATSLSYTTSDHTQSGYFYVLVSSPGLEIVGKAAETVDATAAAADIVVESAL